MKRKMTILILTICFLASSLVPYVYAKKNTSKQKGEQLQTRIDFGNSYISGQSLKSGAVYLLQRKKSDIKTMLKHREDYRNEIFDSYDLNKNSKLSNTNLQPR